MYVNYIMHITVQSSWKTYFAINQEKSLTIFEFPVPGIKLGTHWHPYGLLNAKINAYPKVSVFVKTKNFFKQKMSPVPIVLISENHYTYSVTYVLGKTDIKNNYPKDDV